MAITQKQKDKLLKQDKLLKMFKSCDRVIADDYLNKVVINGYIEVINKTKYVIYSGDDCLPRRKFSRFDIEEICTYSIVGKPEREIRTGLQIHFKDGGRLNLENTARTYGEYIDLIEERKVTKYWINVPYVHGYVKINKATALELLTRMTKFNCEVDTKSIYISEGK